jgi:hypothetical protein
MPLKVSDLERREDTRRKNTLYDHPNTRKAIAERDAKQTAADAVRRRHADERGSMHSRHYSESTKMRHEHHIAVERHYVTSRAKPIAMLEAHAKEKRAMDERHEKERRDTRARHREEIDRAEG